MAQKFIDYLKKNSTIIVITISMIAWMFKSQIIRFNDEFELMSDAWFIANGYTLYQDVFSQHMPFPYYFFAFFAKLGFDSPNLMRIVYAVLVCIIFLIIFRKLPTNTTSDADTYVTKESFAIFIVLALFSTIHFKFHMIIADSFVSLAALIILILVLQKPECNFTFEEIILISSLIFGSITSAIISIYPLIVFYLYYLFNQIAQVIGNGFQRKEKIKVVVLHHFIFLGPFLIWIFLMLVTNTLNTFINDALLFNIKYYGSITEDSGSQIELLKSHIKNVYQYFFDIYKYYRRSDEPFVNTTRLLSISSLYVFVLILFIKKKFRSAVFIFPYVFLLAIRSLYNFHAQPFIIMGLFLFSILVDTIIRKLNQRNGLIRIAHLLLIFLLITYAMIAIFVDIGDRRSEKLGITQDEEIIQKVTNDDDYIWAVPWYPSAYINTRRFPADRNMFFHPHQAMVPGIEDSVIDNLILNDPKVIYYNKEKVLFGSYQMKNYAPKINEFIHENYFQISEISQYLYFSNKYQDMILNRLYSPSN